MDTYNVCCGNVISNSYRGLTMFLPCVKKTGNQSRTCNFHDMCQSCRTRKSQMCRNYHVYSQKNSTMLALQYYFPNVPRHVIQIMQKIGSSDVERDMRAYYERMYILSKDSGHLYYVNNILPKSFVYDDDVALAGNRYWKVILYASIISLYNNDYLSQPPTESLDIALGPLYDKPERSGSQSVCVKYDLITPPLVFECEYRYMFITFFRTYLGSRKYIDPGFLSRYDLETDMDLNILFLINSCRALISLTNLSMKYLFDDSVVYVERVDKYYVLNFCTEHIDTRICIDMESTCNIKPYDYLNLIVSDTSILKAIRYGVIYRSDSSYGWGC